MRTLLHLRDRKVSYSCFTLIILFLAFIYVGSVMSIRSIVMNGDKIEQTELSADSIDSYINENFFNRTFFFELNGWFNKIIDKRELYNTYKLDNGYLTVKHDKVDVGQDADAVIEFRDYLGEQGVNLLYVNVPDKPESDADLTDMGVDCYTNQNADAMLTKLLEAGVDAIDIKEYMEKDKLDFYSMFYRTDHHWTTQAGLYTAGVISEELNRTFGYDIDLSLFKSSNYNFDVRKDCWLGESGRKVSKSYAGLDDFTIITPKFPTDIHLQIPERDIDTTGDFSVMLNTDCYNSPQNLYNVSWHYSYLFGNDDIQKIQNEKQSAGNVMVIKDSFAQVVNPFLALGVKQLTAWDVRYNSDSMKDYIAKNDIDTVIVMYSPGMLGVNRSEGDSLMYRFE